MSGRVIQQGFTLTELIMVIVMLSALAVVAYPRLIARNDANEAVFFQELSAALRYAHKLAINSGCDVQVSIRAVTNRYDLFFRDDASATNCGGGAGFGANPVPNPGQGGAPYAGAAPPDVSIAGDLIFFYDARGRPSNGGGSLSLNTRTLRVEGQTGYVHD